MMGRFRAAIIADITSIVGANIAYKLAFSEIEVYGIVPKEFNLRILTDKMLIKNNCPPDVQYHCRNRLNFVPRDSHDEDDIKFVFSSVWKRYYSDSNMLLVNYVSFDTENISTLTGNDTDMWRPVIDAKLQRMKIYAREATERNCSYILNINSVFGISGMFADWRDAVLSLSEILRKEASEAGSEIKVTTITDDSYSEDKFMQVSIHKFFKYEEVVPSVIAEAVDIAVKMYDWNTTPEITIGKKF